MVNLVDVSQSLLERGLLPDAVIRAGIRKLLKDTLVRERARGIEFGAEHKMNFVQQLKGSAIAVYTPKANEQHYEVPTEFFKLVLGKHMKYSSGYWNDGHDDFDRSQADMLEITVERADIRDGHSVLELGCGWGSLSLYMAEKFPKAKITGVSNSKTQKEHIDAECARRGIKNLEIITADMNSFDIQRKFDRAVSVEMFEHMRNYQRLLAKISGFLNPDGKLFVHIFTHREFAYPYNETDDRDWIAKYFFTGGIMPSDYLLFYFQDHFAIHHHWRVSGTHYQKTSEAWLKSMDVHKDRIVPILEKTYGVKECTKWWNYWRVFFMSCAELWGYKDGTEWMVSHYLFNKRKVT